MKLRKQWMVRIVAGLLLVVLAGGIAYVIRDLLAMRNPESALPVIDIEYNGKPLPPQHYMMDSYSWRFLFSAKEWEEPDRSVVDRLEPAPVLPGAPLDISFSFPYKTITVSRSYGNRNHYEEITGELQTPFTGGVYTYKVEAEWGARGSVLYYIKIRVG
ncbi:DUF3426 domain-containing protein [Ruminococcaceae bacterium OttesenSCG-928-I18]|nr:DUF3426 domain-containing protein [Ruminococcaceae bacterium OttesenSCG-928-I18]